MGRFSAAQVSSMTRKQLMNWFVVSVSTCSAESPRVCAMPAQQNSSSPIARVICSGSSMCIASSRVCLHSVTLASADSLHRKRLWSFIARLQTFCARISAGRVFATASRVWVRVVWCLVSSLMASQFFSTSSVVSAWTVLNTWGWRTISLLQISVQTSSRVKCSCSVSIRVWNTTWSSRSPSSSRSISGSSWSIASMTS